MVNFIVSGHRLFPLPVSVLLAFRSTAVTVARSLHVGRTLTLFRPYAIDVIRPYAIDVITSRKQT